MEKQRRIIITAGDARVGKSTSARLLIDLYLSKSLNLHVSYNGHRNKLDIYKNQLKIHKFNLQKGDYDDFLGSLQNQNNIDVVVMDMPGQILPEFIKFNQSIYMAEGLQSLGYKITFLHPISFRKDCIEDLIELINEFENQADYIIIKNEYFGNRFPYYDDNIDAQLTINSLSGVVINLPALSNIAYQQVEASGCSYSAAVEASDKINTIERSFIFNWIKKFNSAIYSNNQLLKYLGLT